MPRIRKKLHLFTCKPKRIDIAMAIGLVIWGWLYAWPVVHPWSLPGAYTWAVIGPYHQVHIQLSTLYGMILTWAYAHKKGWWGK